MCVIHEAVSFLIVKHWPKYILLSYQLLQSDVSEVEIGFRI